MTLVFTSAGMPRLCTCGPNPNPAPADCGIGSADKLSTWPAQQPGAAPEHHMGRDAHGTAWATAIGLSPAHTARPRTSPVRCFRKPPFVLSSQLLRRLLSSPAATGRPLPTRTATMVRVTVQPRLQTERWSLYWKESLHTDTECLPALQLEADPSAPLSALLAKAAERLRWPVRCRSTGLKCHAARYHRPRGKGGGGRQAALCV